MADLDPRFRLSADLAARFARIALGHVEREYPNKLDHVLGSDADARSPRELHPVFFGSFDWHSCVHGYWLLARLARRFPDLPEAAEVLALFARRLTPQACGAERAYFERPLSRGFERPYGWAWLLLLQAELECASATAAAAAALAPMAEAVVRRLGEFLPRADHPIRTGVHSNTAFALRLALVFARVRGDGGLEGRLRDKALSWYGADKAARPFEPSGDDFLSPTLMTAELMRAALPAPDFQAWFGAYLPDLARGEPAGLLSPVEPSDRTDGKIAHLDGLNLSRAWILSRLAAASDEPAAARLLAAAAERHLDRSLPHVAGDYMGEHWLASFALLALDGPDP